MAVVGELEFNYYPVLTNAYTEPDSAGTSGDTIENVINTTDKTFYKGDKVLIKKGKDTAIAYNNNFSDSSSYDTSKRPKTFYDNNTVLGGFGDKYFSIQYIDDAWSVTDLGSMPTGGKDWVIRISNNDIVSTYPINYANRNYGRIYEPSELRTFISGVYLGEIDGIHYATGTNTSKIQPYNFSTNSLGTVLNSDTYNIKYSSLSGNKILLLGSGSSNYTKIYQIVDGVATAINSVKIDTSAVKGFIGDTGLEPGDYLFGVTSENPYMYEAPTVNSYLKLYQVQDDYSIAEATVEELDWLTRTNCLLTYDRRTNILLAGTSTGLTAYKFDTLTKKFEEYSLGIQLPEIYSSTDVYYGAMSPDMTRLLVSVCIGDDLESWTIYQINNKGWSIVDNITLNYQPLSVYTGIVASHDISPSSRGDVVTLVTESDKP